MELIHRDISINNILIYDDPKGTRGLLIDWEYAKTVDEILSTTGVGWRSVSTVPFPPSDV
jgi:hypothetical protein